MRSLRILPVSAAQLAVLITFAPLAAMLAFMVVGGLVLGLIFGMPQRFVLSLFHSGCPLLIAFTTLLIPFFLWLSCFNSALYQALYKLDDVWRFERLALPRTSFPPGEPRLLPAGYLRLLRAHQTPVGAEQPGVSSASRTIGRPVVRRERRGAEEPKFRKRKARTHGGG